MRRNTLFVGTALALLASARSGLGKISPKVIIVDYVRDLNPSFHQLETFTNHSNIVRPYY